MPAHGRRQYEPPPGFSLIAGAACLDFSNSVRFRGWAEEFDTITDYGALLDWTLEAGTLSSLDVRRLRRVAKADAPAARRSLQNAWRLRDVLFEVFDGLARRGKVTAKRLALLNEFVQKAGAKRIVAAAGEPFGWGWDIGKDLDAPLWPVSQSAADVLTSGQRELVRQCDAETCLRVFVDSSKNGRRRWCDAAGCGNRHRVREHYRRSRA